MPWVGLQPDSARTEVRLKRDPKCGDVGLKPDPQGEASGGSPIHCEEAGLKRDPQGGDVGLKPDPQGGGVGLKPDPQGKGAGRKPEGYAPTSSMILPMCRDDSISACAAAASARGKTRWITGLTLPDA